MSNEYVLLTVLFPSLSGQTCGQGLQTRKVNCVDSGGGRLPAWRCSRLRTREKRRHCSIPCPRPCTVSEWAEWSRCPDTCQKTTTTTATKGSAAESPGGGILLMETQRRDRSVLETALNGGDRCPGLVQVRPCPLLAASCKSARWEPGDWSPCVLPRGLTCGEGRRSRSLGCSKAGAAARPTLLDCLLEGAGRPPSQSEACHMECTAGQTGGCVLSAWAAWTACPPQCGSVRTRRRKPIGKYINGKHSLCSYPVS